MGKDERYVARSLADVILPPLLLVKVMDLLPFVSVNVSLEAIGDEYAIEYV